MSVAHLHDTMHIRSLNKSPVWPPLAKDERQICTVENTEIVADFCCVTNNSAVSTSRRYVGSGARVQYGSVLKRHPVASSCDTLSLKLIDDGAQSFLGDES